MKPGAFIVLVVCFVCSSATFAQSIFRSNTGLGGYWDWQTNFRTPQYVRVSPTSSTIYASYMTAFDSIYTSESRQTVYTHSIDEGTTWSLPQPVPPIRSGYPALDIGLGSLSRYPVIANHFLDQTWIVFDGFELPPPPQLSPTNPLWPEVALAADSSAILVAGRLSDQNSGRGPAFRIRCRNSLSTWDYTWHEIPEGYCTFQAYVTEANTRGRVGIALSGEFGLSWLESTDNGETWPLLPTVLLPRTFMAGNDSFFIGYGLDLVYLGDDTLITFGVASKAQVDSLSQDGIGFWSEATRFVLAVPHDSVPGAIRAPWRIQLRQGTVGMPAIGLSGSTIVLGFQAFMPDTTPTGFNYSDVFFTYSTDGGFTWSTPRNISKPLLLDERYVSMSKWNAPNQANMVWQEDTSPDPDGLIATHAQQIFCRVSDFVTIVDDHDPGFPHDFSLSQNYPNPFNAVTTIQFELPRASPVCLDVYDVLGREVTSLVSGELGAGRHSACWNATGSASGVYLYRLKSPTFIDTRRLILLK
jgi:hypothetical protein